MRKGTVNDVEDLESRMHLSIVSNRMAGAFFFSVYSWVEDTLIMHREIVALSPDYIKLNASIRTTMWYCGLWGNRWSRRLEYRRMFVAYFDYVHSLQIGLVTKGPEDRVRLVEEIQNRVELGDLSFVHYEHTVVIS